MQRKNQASGRRSELEDTVGDKPLVFITVGTDYHPFDRVVEWVDRWLDEGAEERARCLVQYGASEPPKKAGGEGYFDHESLSRSMREADIVVCHAGPATVIEARRAGRLPVIVPRDPAGGEHVDDHQLRFARHLADAGLALSCDAEDDFRATLNAALDRPAGYLLPDPGRGSRSEARASVRRTGSLIDALVGSRAPRRAEAASATAHATAPGQAPVGPPHSWPSVSVVIPTKDRPELLRGAIDSALAQDYPGDIRCLVVFDGSAPDESLTATDPHRQVQVVSNTRTPGLAGGRNSGILAGDAELVAFCDDDDAWLPGKLRAQVAALDEDPEAAMACCGIRVEYDGTHVDRALPSRRVDRDTLLRSRLTELHPSTFLLRRRVLLETVGLVDEALPGSYAEDYDLLLRAAAHAPVANVPDVLTRVRWHKKSHFAGRWETIARALDALLRSHPDFRTVPRGYARVAGQIAFARAALGQRRHALRWSLRTLRANPREPRAYLALAVASGAVRAPAVLQFLHTRGRGV